MTTTTLFRSSAARSQRTRIWVAFSAFLMKMAQANIRAGSSEPFGL
jgi:hypothetical protein